MFCIYLFNKPRGIYEAPDTREVIYNPEYDSLFAPIQG